MMLAQTKLLAATKRVQQAKCAETQLKVVLLLCRCRCHDVLAGCFCSAAALLEVRRVPELGLLRQRYSEDRLYVIRMKRRSISVGVLDLVPLEAASEQPSGADGSSKSDKPAAAQICGSGPGASKLDF